MARFLAHLLSVFPRGLSILGIDTGSLSRYGSSECDWERSWGRCLVLRTWDEQHAMYAYIAFVFLSIGEGKLSDLPTHAGFSPRPCAESQMFAASFSFTAKNARIAALWERRGERRETFSRSLQSPFSSSRYLAAFCTVFRASEFVVSLSDAPLIYKAASAWHVCRTQKHSRSSTESSKILHMFVHDSLGLTVRLSSYDPFNPLVLHMASRQTHHSWAIVDARMLSVCTSRFNFHDLEFITMQPSARILATVSGVMRIAARHLARPEV